LGALSVLAEGPHWLVIDKPAGLAVHPGPKTPDSLEQLLPALARHGVPPQPVHRLDRDTSGCLLLARRPSAARALSRAFVGGVVDKLYWAIIANPPTIDAGVVHAPLAKRSSRSAGWRMQVDPDGQPARTRWQVLARAGGQALIAFRPETGRTHQIRVHATLLGDGAAIVGDPVYGRGDPGGMLLHARALAFPAPPMGERTEVVAPVPSRFRAFAFDWERLGTEPPDFGASAG
jgi:tRNA pseudouridine32 synthase/23S rRNA pseudouridine746 synthase